MVFKRKTFKKRRTFKKRTNVRSLIKTTVKKELSKNIETKFTVTSIGSLGVSNTPAFGIISVPAVGTADNERIGDTIMIKSLYYNYSYQYEDASNLARFILFQWLQDSSLNAPAAVSILEGSVSDPVYAPYSMNNSQNYRILYDRTHTLSPEGSNRVVQRKGYVTKFPNKKLVFTNSSGGLTANIKRGQIYLLVVSDSAGIPHPDLNCVFKLNYTDA